MGQQAIPQWLFAKNLWITQDDNAITGTSESDIKPSWIIKESNTLNDKRSQQTTLNAQRYNILQKNHKVESIKFSVVGKYPR